MYNVYASIDTAFIRIDYYFKKNKSDKNRKYKKIN